MSEPEVITASRVGVARVRGEFRLLALEEIHPGERILIFEGDLLDHPTRYSVQVDDDLHIDPSVDLDLGYALDHNLCGFLNHSCDPNSRIRGRELLALRPIRPWEEITFDYDTTEYEMAFPFSCRCGHCGGRQIRGFKHLSRVEQRRLLPLLAEHLRRRLFVFPECTSEPRPR